MTFSSKSSRVCLLKVYLNPQFSTNPYLEILMDVDIHHDRLIPCLQHQIQWLISIHSGIMNVPIISTPSLFQAPTSLFQKLLHAVLHHQLPLYLQRKLAFSGSIQTQNPTHNYKSPKSVNNNPHQPVPSCIQTFAKQVEQTQGLQPTHHHVRSNEANGIQQPLPLLLLLLLLRPIRSSRGNPPMGLHALQERPAGVAHPAIRPRARRGPT